MEKKIIIDVRPIVGKLWEQYQGELSQKSWVKKFNISNVIIEILKSKITITDDIILSNPTYKFKFDDRHMEIIYTWDGGININTWILQAKQTILFIQRDLLKSGLNC